MTYNKDGMEIVDLRRIGRRLMKVIPYVGCTPGSRTSLGTGAGGDRTFPIDKRAEDIVIAGLDEMDEPITVISEEIGVTDIKGGGMRVIVDPVDGSRNAVSGIPFYCTSLAVAKGDTIGEIELAYVINLITGDEFWAERGSGAFCNGERMQTQKDDILYLVAYEAQSPGKDISGIMNLLSGSRKTRCLGATALDLSYLALGAISVFVSPAPSRSFDFAGGWLLVKEAGGVITDLRGNEVEDIVLGLKRSSPLLASGNAVLHEKALKSLPG